MNQRKIEIVGYTPAWVAKFDSEQSLLKQALGDTAIKIEHIGSTAVPGLPAKPVIDILIEVTGLSELDSKNSHLESLDYKVMGEHGIAGRRYYQKGGNCRSHHIHAFVTGDSHLLRHRAFRDYLIAHPDISLEYGKIKKQAALDCRNDINQYMNLKNRFIEHHEKLAVKWFGGQ